MSIYYHTPLRITEAYRKRFGLVGDLDYLAVVRRHLAHWIGRLPEGAADRALAHSATNCNQERLAYAVQVMKGGER